MAEQIGTPGSTAETSVNGSRIGATKDKQCPFCHQSFTSSSLGRHLDLYIKEKNPKPADGVHLVDEIRKLRGGITRRQPRTSTSKREDSTPGDTPGPQDRRSPGVESEGREHRSPSLRREPVDVTGFGHKNKWLLNKGSWETTGVMNSIPSPRNGDSLRVRDGDDRDNGKRVESRSRSVSRQMLAKTTFDQKQKMADALDHARAAELAMREMLGCIRAAKYNTPPSHSCNITNIHRQRIEGPTIFDYDPLSLDFPALTLHCLPPPPTLHQSTPYATTTSWSILPPSDQQYEALRAHFSSEFHRWRVACAIATNTPQDDLSYPPQEHFTEFTEPSEVLRRAEAQATELESKLSEHLHKVFAQWNCLSREKQTEIWNLSLARSVGRKSEEIQTLKKEKEFAQQEAAHYKMQVDELSRLQHPREFRMVPPRIMPLDSKMMSVIGELGMNTLSVGFQLPDRFEHVDVAVEQAISRWKEVVKQTRGGQSGMTAQRSLSGDSPSTTRPASAQHPPHQNHNQTQSHNHNQTQDQKQNESQTTNHTNHTTMTNGVEMGSDQDADADMEEDESFVEMIDAPRSSAQRAPEASMTQAANFRLTNGHPNQVVHGGGIEGLENQSCVQGYVRIGA